MFEVLKIKIIDEISHILHFYHHLFFLYTLLLKVIYTAWIHNRFLSMCIKPVYSYPPLCRLYDEKIAHYNTQRSYQTLQIEELAFHKQISSHNPQKLDG